MAKSENLTTEHYQEMMQRLTKQMEKYHDNLLRQYMHSITPMYKARQDLIDAFKYSQQITPQEGRTARNPAAGDLPIRIETYEIDKLTSDALKAEINKSIEKENKELEQKKVTKRKIIL